MRTRFGLLFALASTQVFFIGRTVQAQVSWGAPTQITIGQSDDSHPALVASQFSPSGFNEEFLAFSRTSVTGSVLCVMKTRQSGLNWVDTVYEISDGSTINDFPSLTSLLQGTQQDMGAMLVWQRGTDKPNISWCSNISGSWSSPMPLTSDSLGNRAPQVTYRDSGVGIVWERAGQILFSEYRYSSWTTPIRISPVGDSTNSSPQLVYVFGNGRSFRRPVAMWERKKQPGIDHSIVYSILSETGWSVPDTIALSGDNRNPRFVRFEFISDLGLSYESNRTGNWEIYKASGYLSGTAPTWSYRAMNISMNQSADDRDASFTNVPVITVSSPNLLNFSAGTWRVQSGLSDSILVGDWTMILPLYKTVAPSTIDRNPTISCGIMQSGGLRVWSVWENNATGHWKLYGTSALVPIVAVKENNPMVQSFELHQNYPNPFNPTTTIEFDLPKAGAVTLRVFNLLGQEVRTLVDEKKEPGHHTTVFNTRGLSSGVYVYRLTSNGVVQSRKMLVLR